MNIFFRPRELSKFSIIVVEVHELILQDHENLENAQNHQKGAKTAILSNFGQKPWNLWISVPPLRFLMKPYIKNQIWGIQRYISKHLKPGRMWKVCAHNRHRKKNSTTVKVIVCQKKFLCLLCAHHAKKKYVFKIFIDVSFDPPKLIFDIGLQKKYQVGGKKVCVLGTTFFKSFKCDLNNS